MNKKKMWKNSFYRKWQFRSNIATAEENVAEESSVFLQPYTIQLRPVLNLKDHNQYGTFVFSDGANFNSNGFVKILNFSTWDKIGYNFRTEIPLRKNVLFGVVLGCCNH